LVVIISGSIKSDGVGGGSTFSKPGRMKSNGEIVFDAFIPLQPLAAISRAAYATDRNDFRFDVTGEPV
jgi:hypothetical protein